MKRLLLVALVLACTGQVTPPYPQPIANGSPTYAQHGAALGDILGSYNSYGSYRNLQIFPDGGMYVAVGPSLPVSSVGNPYSGYGSVYMLSTPLSQPAFVVQGSRTSLTAPIGPLVSPPLTGGGATQYKVHLIECTVSAPLDVACKFKGGTPTTNKFPSPPATDAGYVAIGFVSVPSLVTAVTAAMVSPMPPATIAGMLRASDFGVTGDGVDDDAPALQGAINAAEQYNGVVLLDGGAGGPGGPPVNLYRLGAGSVQTYTDTNRVDFPTVRAALIISGSMTLEGLTSRNPSQGPALLLDDFSYDGIFAVGLGSGPFFQHFSIGTSSNANPTTGPFFPTGTTGACIHLYKDQGPKLSDINFNGGTGCYNGLWGDSSGGVDGDRMDCSAAKITTGSLPTIPRWCFRYSGLNPGNSNKFVISNVQAGQNGSTDYTQDYVTGYVFDSGAQSFGIDKGGTAGGLGRGYWVTTSGMDPTASPAPNQPAFAKWNGIGSDHNDCGVVIDSPLGRTYLSEVDITSSNTANFYVTANATSGSIILDGADIGTGGANGPGTNGCGTTGTTAPGGFGIGLFGGLDFTATGVHVHNMGTPVTGGIVLGGPAGNITFPSLSCDNISTAACVAFVTGFGGAFTVGAWHAILCGQSFYSTVTSTPFTPVIRIGPGVLDATTPLPSLSGFSRFTIADTPIVTGTTTTSANTPVTVSPATYAYPTTPVASTPYANPTGLRIMLKLTGATSTVIGGVTYTGADSNGFFPWLPGSTSTVTTNATAWTWFLL